VHTQSDLETFTYILYLDVPAQVVAKHRQDDTKRQRPSTSVHYLRKWQLAEITQLRCTCRQHNILFTLVSPHLKKLSTMLRDFQHQNEEYNLSQAKIRLDDVFAASQGQLRTVLVLDGDKTLAAEDTGTLFWKKVSVSRSLRDEEQILKTLFSSPLGYSYTAFR